MLAAPDAYGALSHEWRLTGVTTSVRPLKWSEQLRDCMAKAPPPPPPPPPPGAVKGLPSPLQTYSS